MPSKSENRIHLSQMLDKEVHAMLVAGAARMYRPLSLELEVALRRHYLYPEKITRPPLGELPPDQMPEARKPGRKPGKAASKPVPAREDQPVPKRSILGDALPTKKTQG
jgi:hypothetical protein